MSCSSRHAAVSRRGGWSAGMITAARRAPTSLCTVLVRLSSPCAEDSHGQIFKLSAILSWESCKCYWVRTFNKKLSFIESNWIAVSGDEWMYGGRALQFRCSCLLFALYFKVGYVSKWRPFWKWLKRLFLFLFYPSLQLYWICTPLNNFEIFI